MALQNLPERIRFFIHPMPLIAVGLMAVNDHWLKYQHPGFLTGKLSDFCGVFYLPLFLLALMATFDEIFELKRFHLSAGLAIAAILFTDALMLIVKLSPSSARGIEHMFDHYLFSIQLVQDSTDLFSLIVNPLSYLYLRPYWTASKDT